jgi:hypothetical protein
MITSNILKLWKLNLLTKFFEITGLLWNAKIYHLEQRQLWLFGLLSANGFQMGPYTSTEHVYVLMVVNKLGGRTIGKPTHLLSRGPVFLCSSLLQKIHRLKSKSIDFVLAFPQADLDVPVYMELPVGVNPVDISDENQRCYFFSQA